MALTRVFWGGSSQHHQHPHVVSGLPGVWRVLPSCSPGYGLWPVVWLVTIFSLESVDRQTQTPSSPTLHTVVTPLSGLEDLLGDLCPSVSSITSHQDCLKVAEVLWLESVTWWVAVAEMTVPFTTSFINLINDFIVCLDNSSAACTNILQCSLQIMWFYNHILPQSLSFPLILYLVTIN